MTMIRFGLSIALKTRNSILETVPRIGPLNTKDVSVSGLHHQLEEAVLSFLLALSVKYLRGLQTRIQPHA